VIQDLNFDIGFLDDFFRMMVMPDNGDEFFIIFYIPFIEKKHSKFQKLFSCSIMNQFMPLYQPLSSFIYEFLHFHVSLINMPSMAAALSYSHKV
jgi:hypothetical protein